MSMSEVHEIGATTKVTVTENVESTNPLDLFVERTLNNFEMLGKAIPGWEKKLLDLKTDGQIPTKSKLEKWTEILALPMIAGYETAKLLVSGKNSPLTESLRTFFSSSGYALRNFLETSGMGLDSFTNSPDAIGKLFGVKQERIAVPLLGLGMLSLGRDIFFPSKNSDSLFNRTTSAILLAAVVGMVQREGGHGNLNPDLVRKIEDQLGPAAPAVKAAWGQRRSCAVLGCLFVVGALSCAGIAGTVALFGEPISKYVNDAEFRRQTNQQAKVETPAPTPVLLTEEQRIKKWVEDTYHNHQSEENPLNINNKLIREVTAYVGATWMWDEKRVDYLNQIFGPEFQKKFGRPIDKDDVAKYKNPTEFINLLKQLEVDPKIIDFYQKRIDLMADPNGAQKFLDEIGKQGLNAKNFLAFVGLVSAGRDMFDAGNIANSKHLNRRAFLLSSLRGARGGAKAILPEFAGALEIISFLQKGLKD